MPSIVIVGGGFAGINAALAAVRTGGEAVTVSLVSRDRWLVVRPRLYESQPSNLRTDLTTPLSVAGAEFIEGDATTVADGQLELASGVKVPFDRLVVATGSVMRRPAFPGAELCHSIDDWPSAMAFDARLAEISRLAIPRVAVIGAGFTGIELALELRDRIWTHSNTEASARAHIVLFDAATEVGAELGAGPRPVIDRALGDARVDVRLGVTIVGTTATAVSLAGGETLVFDAVVMCTGLQAAPFVAKIKGDRDRFGRLVASTDLRAPQDRNIFVAGDAVCAETEPGRHTLMSCQHALTLGRYAGENAARDLLGIPLLNYAQPRYTTCLSLGRSGAVFSEGWDRVPKLVGQAAGAIKTEINSRRIYPPTGSREEILAVSGVR